MGCSTSFAKIFLFVFNIIFFLLGCACLGIGIWIVVNKNSLFDLINLSTQSITSDTDKSVINNYLGMTPMVTTAAYVLIAMGAFTFVVGFCGCCGAMKESKFLLYVYAICVSLVLVIEIAAAILAGVFKSKVTTELGKHLITLQDKYFVSYKNFSTDANDVSSKVTTLFNYAQILLECCGVNNIQDIKNSTSWVNSIRSYENGTMEIPLTCCTFKNKDAFLKDSPWNDFFAKPENYLSDATCPLDATKGIQRTCFSKIDEYITQYAVPLIAGGVCIALFELLVIAITCCLIRSLEENY